MREQVNLLILILTLAALRVVGALASRGPVATNKVSAVVLCCAILAGVTACALAAYIGA